MSSLSLSDIGMTWPDGTVALDGVSLTVPRGQFVACVGPSGCGKSTLLRIAAGLNRPTVGAVAIDREMAVGYVFQDPTLLPWRTVQANVELLGELHGLSRLERMQRARNAIALVGLAGFEGHYPKTLSGGMRMRVSLARSLTLSPGLFLFDEPFGSLDEITRERLHSEVQGLFLIEGFAGLLVTHSVSEAVFLSHRVLVMSPRPGRIVADIEVPFSFPRPPALRFDPAFARLAGTVSHSLRENVA